MSRFCGGTLALSSTITAATIYTNKLPFQVNLSEIVFGFLFFCTLSGDLKRKSNCCYTKFEGDHLLSGV